MRSRNLTPTISATIAVIVLAATALTDIILMFYMQHLLVQSEIRHYRRLIPVLGRTLDAAENAGPERLAAMMASFPGVGEGTARYAVLLMASADRTPVVAPAGDERFRARASDILLQAVRTGEDQVRYSGGAFGVFWRQHRGVTIACPLQRPGGTFGAAAVSVSLVPLYEDLRKGQWFVVFYVVVNTVVLTALGTFLIYRITVQPIRRLVRAADQRRGEYEFFHLGETASNDYQRLSNSLNQMMMRIRDDRQQLQQTVSSLERANRKLQDARDQVVRAEKMASVGRMAAGLAHEIGNPIGIVLGYLQMLQRPHLPEDKRRDFLERSQGEVERIRTILRQLLHFSRSSDADRRWVSVHALLQDLIETLDHQPATRGIRLESELQAEDEAVFVDELQLRQVFLNLIINAADSIRLAQRGESGRIRVRTENAEAASNGEDAPPSKRIRITVADNGTGFSEEDRDNLFDPFYTTKDPGKGTGLGLSVSFSIVENLGGTIRAGNRPRGGAEMVVELPLSSASEQKG